MAHNRPWLSALVVSAALLIAGCSSPPPATQDLGATVDQAAATLVAQPLLHATSIAVVHGRQEVIRHRGDMVAGRAGPPTDATLYEIGSLSKTLAGTLMANAVLEKRLGLDDDVRRYLQGDYPNLQYQGEPLRIRHLLTHSSGLPNMLPETANTVLADFLDHDTPRRLNAIYAHYGKPEFLRDLHAVQIRQAPGTRYAYSSAGTELAAHILETVYGRDYEPLLRDFFHTTAGMDGLRIALADADAPRLAVGYHSDNTVPTTPMPALPWAAAGGVRATVPDMVKFLQLQLGDGPVVAESHRALATFDREFGVGYFWNRISGDSMKGDYFVHHGGVPRSQCYVYILPRYDLGIFIITNQSGDQTARAMEKAVDTIVSRVAALERAAGSSAAR